MIDITPHTNLIESIRQQNLPWTTIFGELIDNSLDAGANRVAIEFTKDNCVITDDGKGCDDLRVMLAPGARKDHATTELGRYGIGAKDAAISAADTISIESVCNGVVRSVSCSWKVIAKSGEWKVADPMVSATSAPSGTKIILSACRKVWSFDNLVEDLQFRYTPAIKRGKQILIRTKTKGECKPLAEFVYPALDRHTVRDVVVAGNKARVTMGIVPDGVKFSRRGMSISYGYRVILQNTAIGFGGKPVPGLVGICELGDGWELSKNKTEVTKNIDELGDAIASAFADLIEHASQRSQSIQFDNVAKELNTILEDIGGCKDKKAKRSEPKQSGLVLPSGRGGQHTRAASVQIGNRFASRAKGLSISFDTMGEDGPSCRCDGSVVYLNTDIPAIKKDWGNEEAIARHAIYAVSMYLALRKDLELFRDFTDDFERVTRFSGYLISRFGVESRS